jgi:hypothetical protein
MRRIISPDVKVLSGPLFVIVLASTLIFLGFNISYEAITTRIEGYKTSKNAERSLTAKLDILKGVEQGSLERSNRLAQILPESHPAAAAISQLKLKSQEALILTNLELKNEVQLSDNINSADFLFEGTSENVTEMIGVLLQLGKTAPLNNLKKVEISLNVDGFIDSKVESNIFWSPYPENISSVTAPVSDFTDEENIKIAELNQYELPVSSQLNPVSPVERENPFN